MSSPLPPNDYAVAPRYYDLFYSHRDDIPFYLRLAKRARGPVLDAMCGTGRMTIPLARAGIGVTGVELRDGALRVLEDKLMKEDEAVRARVTLRRGDISRAQLGGPYALAAISWNSINELVTARAQQAALRNIARHLQPEAQLAFHADCPRFIRPKAESQLGTKRDEDGSRVDMYVRVVSRGNHVWDHMIRYRIVPPGGRERTLRTMVRTRYPPWTELRGMLIRAGFSIESVFGDYDMRPYGPSSRYMIVLARKSGGAVGGGG